MYVCLIMGLCTWVQCPRKSEERIGSPGVLGSCELLTWVWGSKPRSSGRAVHVQNRRANSLAPYISLLKKSFINFYPRVIKRQSLGKLNRWLKNTSLSCISVSGGAGSWHGYGAQSNPRWPVGLKPSRQRALELEWASQGSCLRSPVEGKYPRQSFPDW